MTQTAELPVAAAPGPPGAGPRRPIRALVALGLVAALAATAVVLYESGVFKSGGGGNTGALDNGYPTALQTVVRRPLSSQTQVSATLGYAHTGTIVLPGGTTPTNMQQATQQVTTAQNQLATAQAALRADSAALTQDQAVVSAAREKLAVDCGGNGAAQSPAAGGSGGSGGGGACATDAQSLATGQQSVTQAASKVTSDGQSVVSAQAGVTSAQASLSQLQASATLYGQSSTYTELPAIGQVVARGGTLFQVSGQPVVLLYGSVAPWRVFAAGMAPGQDVAELNANLQALGYGTNLGGDAFTPATAAAIDAFQAAHGESQTGTLLLGSVVFEPGAVRVTSVTPTLGATVQAGPVLAITSTVREVTIALDAAQQSQVKVGDPVTITLPDNSTTPGRVSYVGTVATTPSNSGGNNSGNSTPTIEVDVTPTDPAATGRLDQAPVNVSITTASVPSALVVPVNALLALASGGYAVEVAGAGGIHHLVGVSANLFDDADGLVSVSGAGLRAGQRVVVPGGGA
jgi:hypothetical protein